MVRVKFYIIKDTSKESAVPGFSFFVDMPARPIKGDTFMFNETIQGLEVVPDDLLDYMRENEFGIQSSVWEFDEDGPFLVVTLEEVL